MVNSKAIFTNITVPNGQNYKVLSVAGLEAPSDPASVGISTHTGVIVARLSGSVGAFSLASVAEIESNPTSPSNILYLRDVVNHQPIMSGSKEIYGLLQVSSSVNNGDLFNDTTKQIQISFVVIDDAGDALEAANVGDIEGIVFQYLYYVQLPLYLTSRAAGPIFQEPVAGGGGGGVGPRGPAGPTGSQGIQGSPGVTGSVGPQGNQGVQGVTGMAGIQGIQGVTGPAGSQGIQGATGLQGIQGSPGITGITGSIGPQGNQGIQGSPGVTGAVGPTGIQGITGAVGPTGSIGPTGPQGIQGVTGPAGGGGGVGTGTVAASFSRIFMFMGG